MDNRAIGVFDSGLGGLTAVRRLREVLPREDIVYLGDTGRVPYGGRSRETIMQYAREDFAFLMGFDIKAIVVACGTVSTVALPEMAGDYALPVVGVVEPAAKKAAGLTKNGRIGLIATRASVASGAYEREIARIAPDKEVFSQACPLFVPLVENGRVAPGDVVIETVAREYLEPLREKNIDTLILGCTHYPIIRDVIAGIMGPGVALVDTGGEAAATVASMLRAGDALADRAGEGICRCCVTDSVESFNENAGRFLGGGVISETRRVSLN
ncbi:MAG: glutamate racemase [Oscillospiraceae bacterium]|nr:glutamate racemase [Oscillospiraceae bacterium]